MIFHGGAVPGSLTEVAFYPRTRLGLVALMNSDDPHGVQVAVPRRIAEDLLGLAHSFGAPPPPPPSPSPPAARAPPADKPAQDAQADAVPLARYEGAYADAGYGALRLCAREQAGS